MTLLPPSLVPQCSRSTAFTPHVIRQAASCASMARAHELSLWPDPLTLSPLHFGSLKPGSLKPAQAKANVTGPRPAQDDAALRVNVTPTFMQAIDRWMRQNPQAAPHQWAQILKTASWVLDDGGSEAEAIAAMFLPQALEAQSLQQLKTRLKGLPDAAIQSLVPVLESVSSGVGDFLQDRTSTPANEQIKTRFLQFSEPIRRLILGHLMAQLEIKSHQGYTSEPLLSHGDKKWLREMMDALENAKKATPLSRIILRNLEAARTVSEASVLQAGTSPKNKVVLGKRFLDALEMAREIHQDQRRRDTNSPYLTHLLHVAATVLEMGGSENAAIAALLHDGPEDQGGEEMLAKITLKFGPEVSRMVSECTILWEEDWLRERQAYLRNINPALHPETPLVMLADKGHNLQSVVRSLTENGPSHWSHFARGKAEQLWFYRSARSALSYCLGKTPYLSTMEDNIHLSERLSYGESEPIFRLLAQKYRSKEEAHTLKAALKEIADTPALQQLNQLTRSLPSTMPQETRTVNGKTVPAFSPERAEQHERMLAVEYQNFMDQRASALPGKGFKRAHIVTGPFGAGKSCFITLPLAEQDCALNIDADVFKKQFPQEYHVPVDHPMAVGLDLDPKNGLGATAVHQESSYLTTRLMNQAMDAGDSFIMSYTGLDLDWDKRMITDLKARGYQVYVHHMQVSLKTSLNRMFHRYRTEGRYTPADILVKKSRSSTDNFIKLKDWGYQQGLIDGYSWYFNDIQEGSPPVLIESLSATDEPFLPDTVHASCVLNH